MNPFVIHPVPFPAQQHVQSAIAKARPLCRQLPQSRAQARRHPFASLGTVASSAGVPPACKPAVPRRRTGLRDTARRSDEPQALRVFCQEILEHLVIERLLGDQPLQAGVLRLQGFQPVDVRPGHPAVFLFPAIDRLLTDAVPAADLGDAGTGLMLLQDR